MKFMTYLLFLPVISVFILSTYAEDTVPDISIPRAAVCADVQAREPVGSDVNFPETSKKIFFFTEIKSSFPGTIKHVWYYKNTKLGEIELEYGAGQYRTWSYHVINPGQTGEWKVEATINGNNVIKRLIFAVGIEE